MNADAERLAEIRDEMSELLAEARSLLPVGQVKSRAEAYWVPTIAQNLGDADEWMGGAGCSMSDSIGEMEAWSDDEDE